MVVPAHNAAETIGETLAALAAQDFDRPVEVVVADDCSSDATPAIAARSGARVVRLPQQEGPAAARNAAVASTSAGLLAFTDADCEPSPDWLRHGVAALEAGADLVTGPIEPLRDPGPFDRTLNVSGPSPLFESANVFVCRALFDRLGGFRRPERLALTVEGGHFGEDVLFGWRAVREGARAAYAPQALVRHAVFPRGAAAYVAERWRLRFFPMLLRDAPELRSGLPLRIFLSPRTAAFDAAVAGLCTAAAARRAWPLAAAFPYVWSHLRGGQPWRRWVFRRNVAYVVGDAVGLAALLYGSLIHRRLLI